MSGDPGTTGNAVDLVVLSKSSDVAFEMSSLSPTYDVTRVDPLNTVWKSIFPDLLN